MNEVDPRKTVLLVDDAPANIQVATSILKDTYKIRVATNGAKALALVKDAPPPDLILLDVMMPEMDGYEVCTRLKADPETANIPIVAVTNAASAGDEASLKTQGIAALVTNPINLATFCQTVGRLMRK